MISNAGSVRPRLSLSSNNNGIEDPSFDFVNSLGSDVVILLASLFENIVLMI